MEVILIQTYNLRINNFLGVNLFNAILLFLSDTRLKHFFLIDMIAERNEENNEFKVDSQAQIAKLIKNLFNIKDGNLTINILSVY